MFWILLAACFNPITNDFVIEDQAFLDALPNTVAQTELPERTELQRGAKNFLGLIESLLSWIDLVSAMPPTIRETDRRVWGPFREEPADFSWKLEIIRAQPGRYQWRFSMQRGDGEAWAPYFDGESLTGYAATDSKGTLRYDSSIIAAVSGEDDFGVMEASYDFIGARRVDAEVQGTDGISSTYTLDQFEDTADLGYTTYMDLDQNGSALERYELAGRWLISGAGRSDADITGGDLGPLVAHITECWDDTGTITYQRSFIESITEEVVGEPASCAFLDRIEQP